MKNRSIFPCDARLVSLKAENKKPRITMHPAAGSLAIVLSSDCLKKAGCT